MEHNGANWLDLDYRPALPQDRTIGIGIVAPAKSSRRATCRRTGWAA
ncbi:hypothetical protein [Gordoniibacillus kamchatkensis]|nr:hypothetical protein [Paenibacillus sp. VKM B-2647]